MICHGRRDMELKVGALFNIIVTQAMIGTVALQAEGVVMRDQSMTVIIIVSIIKTTRATKSMQIQLPIQIQLVQRIVICNQLLPWLSLVARAQALVLIILNLNLVITDPKIHLLEGEVLISNHSVNQGDGLSLLTDLNA